MIDTISIRIPQETNTVFFQFTDAKPTFPVEKWRKKTK